MCANLLKLTGQTNIRNKRVIRNSKKYFRLWTV